MQEGLSQHLCEAGGGTISGLGCIAQAWGVAEVLRRLQTTALPPGERL